MQRFATGPVIVVFSLFAAWITYNATRVVIAADDRPAVFWTAIAILYALIIGFGASVGFHWFSDVVAGAFLGTLMAFKTQRASRFSGI